MRLHERLCPPSRMVRLPCFIDQPPLLSKRKYPSMEGESKRSGHHKLHIIDPNHAQTINNFDFSYHPPDQLL
jgi:hypothetical protein